TPAFYTLSLHDALPIYVVMLSVADQHVVNEMLVGENGVFGSLPQNGCVVDMSTVPPGFARDLAVKAAEAGYRALDACVLGNPQRSEEHTSELQSLAYLV